MDPRSIIAIVIASAIVWRQAARSYTSGLRWTIFFLVWMPHAVRIEVPGLPEFTVHRILLLILIGAGLGQGRFRNWTSRVPLYGLIVAMFLTYCVSVTLAPDIAFSIKRLFANLFENYVLYICIMVGDWSQDNAECLLKSALSGLILIATLAPLEYYQGLNFVGKFMPVSFDDQGVISTYEHSIHFGYAMAIGIPIAIIFANKASHFGRKLYYFAGSGVLLFACYVSFSRGALLGAILAVGLVLLFGGRALRKTSSVIAAIIALGLILRPGVRETVGTMLTSVVDAAFGGEEDQDASAEYRKVLWTVAWTKISANPINLLFGMGGGSTAQMNIQEFFGRGRGGQVMEQGFSSWDSQWAANLVQYGLIGFSLEAIMWLRIFYIAARAWLSSRDTSAALIVFAAAVGCAVYVWAMLTVAMFSPQLRYLASLFVACGIIAARSKTSDQPDSTADDEDFPPITQSNHAAGS